MNGGVVMAFGPCLRCRRLFGFNPHKVPSMRINDGPKEPICEACFDYLNSFRESQGLEPWKRMPDAYEPLDEQEL
jgi:hypothetical protein